MNRKLISLALVAIFVASSFAVPAAYANTLAPGEGMAAATSNITSERANYMIVLNPPNVWRLYVQVINITFPAAFDISDATIPMAFGIPTRRSTVIVDEDLNTISYDFGRRYRLRPGRLAVLYVANIANAPAEGTFTVTVKLIDHYGNVKYTYNLPVFITYVNGSMIEDQSITGDDIDPTTTITIAGLTVNGLTDLNGNLDVAGEATFNDVTHFNDVMDINDVIRGDLIPETTLTYNVGNSTNEWAEVWAGEGFFSTNVRTPRLYNTGDLLVEAAGDLTLRSGIPGSVLIQYFSNTIAEFSNSEIDFYRNLDMNGNWIYDSTGNLIIDDNVVPRFDSTYTLGVPGTRWYDIYADYGHFTDTVYVGATITIDGINNIITASLPDLTIDVAAASGPLNIHATNFWLDSDEADFFVNADMNGNIFWDSTGDLQLAAQSGTVHVLNDTLQVGSSIFVDNALNAVYSSNAAPFNIRSANGQNLVLEAGSDHAGQLLAYGQEVHIFGDTGQIELNSAAANIVATAATSIDMTAGTDINMQAGQDINQIATATWFGQANAGDFDFTTTFDLTAGGNIGVTSTGGDVTVQANAGNLNFYALAGTVDVDANALDIDVTTLTTLNTADFDIVASTSGRITTPEWEIDELGNAWFNGNVDLGDDVATDTVTFQSTVDSNIWPTTSGMYDLGSSLLEWDNVFAQYGNFSQQVKVGSSILITTDTISSSAALTIQTAPNSDMLINARGTGDINMVAEYLTIDTNNVDLSTTELDLYVDLDMNAKNIYDSVGELDLADDVNLGGLATDTITFVGKVDSHIIPNADNTYDLGENTTPLRFRTGYFGTSVVVGSSVTITTAAISASGTLDITSQGAMDIYSVASTVTVEDVVFSDNTISTTTGLDLILNANSDKTVIQDALEVTKTISAVTGLGTAIVVDQTANSISSDVDADFTIQETAAGRNLVLTTASGLVRVADELEVTSTSTFIGDATFNSWIYADGGISTHAGNLILDPFTDVVQVGSSIYIDNANNKIYSDNMVPFTIESRPDYDLILNAPSTGTPTKVVIQVNTHDEVTIEGGQVTVDGNLLPTSTAANYNLGSATQKWYDIYLSNDVIVDHAVNVGATVTVDNTGIHTTDTSLAVYASGGTAGQVQFGNNDLTQIDEIFADTLHITTLVETGNLDVTGTLSVDYITSYTTNADLQLEGDGTGIVHVLDSLRVGSSIYIDSSLAVNSIWSDTDSDFTIQTIAPARNLVLTTTSGLVQIADDLQVTGSATVGTTLTVNGLATLAGGFTATAASSITSGGLSVTGGITTDSLTVTGTVNLPDNSVQFRDIQITFGTETAVNVGAGSTSIIPEGMYIVRTGPNTVVEYSPDGGTTWYTLVPAGSSAVIVSDGANVRFNNGGAAAENSYLLPIE